MAPKWQVLADALRAQIEDGTYPPGAALPPMDALVAQGEGSRTTVHQAYRALEAGGYVVMAPRRGTVVRDRTPIRVPLSRYGAVLAPGGVQMGVSEGRSEPFDTGVFTHCGIDPRRKKYVLIKSRQHFRAGFEPIARHIVLCDGDGVTSSDLRLFTYRNRPRPLFPFER